jgi:hypothetical protein
MSNVTTAGFQQSVPLPTVANIGSPVIAYEGDSFGQLVPGSTSGGVASVDLTVAKGAFWLNVNQENSSLTNVQSGSLPVAGIVLRSNATSFAFANNPSGIPADQQGFSMTIASGLNADILQRGSVWVKITTALETGGNSLYGSAVWIRDADGLLITEDVGTAVANATLTTFTVGSMGATAPGTLLMITNVNDVA